LSLVIHILPFFLLKYCISFISLPVPKLNFAFWTILVDSFLAGLNSPPPNPFSSLNSRAVPLSNILALLPNVPFRNLIVSSSAFLLLGVSNIFISFPNLLPNTSNNFGDSLILFSILSIFVGLPKILGISTLNFVGSSCRLIC